MEDDREKTISEALADAVAHGADDVAANGSDVPPGRDAFPDDAESNRSDDTALEEEVSGQITEDSEEDAAADAADEVAESELDAEPALEEAEVAVAETEEEAPAVAKPPRAPAKKKPAPEPEEEIRMDWYILKVQSNRERSIAEALERKMRIEGLDRYFDQVIVPTEKVTEFKGGKKKVVERKLYPGYIVVHMHINDDTWFAVRETSGVGDFTGAGGKPTPMLPHEVSRIIQTEEEETSEAPKLDIRFSAGDKVKVKEGNFENFEGEVNSIDEASGRVIVMINIFGRSTPVELEYWQIELV
jgi:transcriptional antiterminator NusG